MLNLRRIACTLPLALAAATTPAIAAPQAPADVVTYAIRPGENLYRLAALYLDRIASFRIVQRLNHIADPHRVPIGTLLQIPLTVLRAEPQTARIAAVRGGVRIHDGSRTIEPKVGTELPQGALVETGDDGFITLALPNGSRTSLPTRSSLAIVHLRRFVLTQSIDYDFTVESGKADTRAAPLGSGNGLFRIRTPRAVAAVRGTQFRVGVAGTASLTEVLEGTVAAGASGAVPEPVGKGFGAVIDGGRITREALLPAPALLAPGKVQVDPLVRLAYQAVPGASGYHLLLAADAGFTEVIAETRTTRPLFELAGIPNGALFVRASAIAASGLEGMVQTYAMRRTLTGLVGSAAADADRMVFKWGGEGEGRRLYRFQLYRGQPDGTPVVDEPGLQVDGLALRALKPDSYYWRVGVRQVGADDVTENWLSFDRFIVSAPER